MRLSIILVLIGALLILAACSESGAENETVGSFPTPGTGEVENAVGVLETNISECHPPACSTPHVLWSPDFGNFYPLEGEFQQEDSGKFVKLSGFWDLESQTPVALDPTQVAGHFIKVKSYEVLGGFSYPEDLNEMASEYVVEQDCPHEVTENGQVFTWNKTYAWSFQENPTMSVIMTDTESDENPQPNIVLTYNLDGDLVEAVESDSEICQD